MRKKNRCLCLLYIYIYIYIYIYHSMMNEFYMRLFLIEFYKKVLVSSVLGNKLSSSLMIFLKINRFNIIIYLTRKFVFNYNTFISLHVYPKQANAIRMDFNFFLFIFSHVYHRSLNIVSHL
jgi:hypothetical protein